LITVNYIGAHSKLGYFW